MPHCNKKMISFFLTTKCNLCCIYCYNEKERNEIDEKSLPLEIAFAGIDWYFSNNESRHIRFYGPGEPTQEFLKMQQITDYARNHPNRGKDVTAEIQTNGVFTQDIRDWMLDNMNIIWVSFDGMPAIQNHNRPINPKYRHIYDDKSSAEVVESNVYWLNNNRSTRNIMVGARVTITNKNVNKQKEMVDYFYSLGVRYVWTNPLFYSVGKIPVCQDVKKIKNFHFDMDSYLSNYLDAYYYGKKKGIFWGSFLTVNFDGESLYHCRCCTPLNAPHLTPDGYISSCDMVLLGSNPHHMEPFVVGRWDDSTKSFIFDRSKIVALNERKSSNMQHCKDCPVQTHCGGYCLGEIVNETGSLYGQNIIKCNAIRYLFEQLGCCEQYKYLHP